MTIPLGRLRLRITLSRASDHPKGWEEWVAPGMDDLDLARLNQGNMRRQQSASWTALRLIQNGGWTH